MSRKNRANFKTSKNQNFPDNTTGLITPQKPRDSFEDTADSVPFFEDEFLLTSKFDAQGGLTDGPAITWNCANRIQSTMFLVTVESAINLTINGLLSGTIHHLFLRKDISGDVVITLPANYFGLSNDGALATITLTGPTQSRYMIQVWGVRNSWIIKVIESTRDGQINVHDRGNWNTTDTLPNTGSGAAGAWVKGDEWMVPTGSTWTYGDDVWPEYTIIKAMATGGNTYAQLKKY